MLNKKYIHFFLFALLLIGALSWFSAGETPLRASSSDNLSGYAWSETIGWISFNCTNSGSCGTSNYGVTVAPSGALSGYAWSENIGWISFNSADTASCPSAPCAATLNSETSIVSGWAKALAGEDPQSGGWDGWIHLRGIAADASSYGVSANYCSWGGWAWGSDVVGWIHFAGTNYGVIGTGDGCASFGGPLQVSCSASPETVGINEPVTWTAFPEGGTGGNAYLWSGSPPLDGQSSNPSTISYGTGGEKLGSITVTSGLEIASADCPGVVTVTGGPGPDLAIQATPTTIFHLGTTVISWSANPQGVEPGSCLVRGNGNLWSGNSGSETTNQITETTTYTLECTNLGGEQVTEQVTIRLIPRFEEF